MATITVGEDFILELAAAIVKLQLGGETIKPDPNQADTWPAGPPDDDPWSTPGTGAASPPVGPTVEVVNTPKGTQTWTLNLPSAPACLCGQPSAHIQGVTNGRVWTRYGCAKAKDKATYRSKCDFSQWA